MPAFAYIWKCLLLHNSTANICLYSTTSPCPLPIKRLTSITKSAKLNGQLLLKESRDSFVQSAFVSLNAKKWVATDVVANRLTRLDFKKIMDYHQSHKAGFGAISILEISAKNSHAYQKLPSSVQEEAEEEKTLARAIQLKLQGQWTKWCSFIKMDLCRKSVLQGLISVFQSFLSSYTVSNTNCNTSIKFVKAGLKPKKSIKKKVGLLHFAPGWKLQFNLNNKLVIPLFVTVSQLRQDVVVYSLSTKTVTMSFVLGNGFHSLVSASFS